MTQYGPSAAPRAIVVMGVSGSGKSTLGRVLAEMLHVPFLEGDDYHPPSNRQKMSAGLALDDNDRWPWLDALGAATRVAARESSLAIASCSALKRSYRERLRQASGVELCFVWLDAERAVLEARMKERAGHFMPSSLLDSQLATLEPPDASESMLRLQAATPLSELIVAVNAALQREGG
jgi:gluconokinase